MSKFEVFWVSEDDQGQMPGGEFDTRREADASLADWLNEMLVECADHDEREEILSGTFRIVGDDDESFPVRQVAEAAAV